MRRLIYIIMCTLVCVTTSAQEASGLSASVLDYYAKLPQEKLYVHTDKSCYAAGDTVWLRAYVLDAATNRLSHRSKFVYIELHDNKADTLVMRKKLKADTDSVFANALPLPKTLPDGAYTLAAYTQWQRNFGEDTFYKKQLQVASSQPSQALPQPSPKGKETSPLRGAWGAFTLSLHPEGGNLIAGIHQRLAYKAVDANGFGVDVSVRLLNSDGETIQESASQHLGMGEILLYVSPGERLFLEATALDGTTVREPLPDALPQGATLSVSQRNGNLLIQPLATDGLSLEPLQILIYGAGNLMTIDRLDKANPVIIPLKNLKSGVLNIALVNPETKQIHAERLAFVR